MINIFFKELNTFFSSLIGYIVISVFLVLMGLIMWVFPDSSVLASDNADLFQLFANAPVIFIFLVPAITMRALAEERQSGTIELLSTRPLTDLDIVLGKFFACVCLLIFALIPTLIYVYSVYQLGAPVGNLDIGGIMGSYIGLILLGACFVAIGLFASSLTDNQIIAFILASFLCFFFFFAFTFLSGLPAFVGKLDSLIQLFGIEYHYGSMGRGLLDTRDIIYFISIIISFIAMTVVSLGSRKW